VKKTLFFSLVFIIGLSACNRKEFINKMCGTWKLTQYIYANQDYTKTFMDTTNVNYQFILDQDERYTMSWISYTFTADTQRIYDTVSHDTVTGTYTIDTIIKAYVDSTEVPTLQSGAWVLINSQEDIQLTPDSDQSNPVQYQILKLTKNNFNLLKGNQQYNLTK
jgi:hypothetical protein